MSLRNSSASENDDWGYRKLTTGVSLDAVAEGVGYQAVGPLCYGFAYWLVGKAREAGIKNLYFLSRDGWLLKQAFDLLPQSVTEGIQSHYLYSSRRAVWFASLHESTPKDEYNEILSGASPYLPVKSFLQRIFIDPAQYKTEIQAAGFYDENSVVEVASDRLKLYALFKALKPVIVAKAAQERRDYLAYLKHEGVLEHKRSGLVDVGWTGSIMKYTRALVRDAADGVELFGYFIGVGENARDKYGFSKGDCLHGYLFDFDDSKHFFMRRYFYIIENFLSPDEPSLIKMTREGDEFKPIGRQSEQGEAPYKSVVQDRALQFVRDQIKSSEVRGRDPKHFLPQLKAVLTNPDLGTARLLSQYSYSYDFGYIRSPANYAKSESPSIYLRNPLQLLKDYRRALWKPGFIALQPAPAKFLLKIVEALRLARVFNWLVMASKKLR